MPVTADLDIKIGDEFASPKWAVIISDVAVDLTQGWTVRAQIRRRAEGDDVLHTFTGTGVRVTAPVVGTETTPSTVQLYASPTETAAFDAWVAFWDLEIEHPTYGLGGVLYRKTVVSGVARSSWDVTRG